MYTMDDFHVVTVATQSKYYFPYLVQSCKRHGKELEVLGFGEKWGGFNHKNRKMVEYLKTLPKNHIVCFVDGYDVLCVRDLKELKDAFVKIQKETNCKIVVAQDGADPRVKRLNRLYLKTVYGQCQRRNINSGTYVGYSGDLLEILQNIYEENPNDNISDQKLLTSYCKKHESIFHIDTDILFFGVIIKPLADVGKVVHIENQQVFINNKRPFFIHAVAGGYLDSILVRLGYDYDSDNKIKDQIFKNMMTDKLVKSLLLKYLMGGIVVVVLVGVGYKYRTRIFKGVRKYKKIR